MDAADMIPHELVHVWNVNNGERFETYVIPGARGSGTNDKAGSILNLVRWVSARNIKETFSPPLAYEYPFMAEE